jgi:hypothetical protein
MLTDMFFSRKFLFLSIIGIIVLVLGVQQFIFISNIQPTCSIKITSNGEEVKSDNNGSLFIRKGQEININWNSSNAMTATDTNGDGVLLSGTMTDTPDNTTTYAYKFVRNEKSVICSSTINTVSGGIDKSSLTSILSKPTIFGTATGTNAIQIKINKTGSIEIIYEQIVDVVDGKWKVEIAQSLSIGTYDVSISASGNVIMENLASGILVINNAPVVKVNPPVITNPKPPVVIPKPIPVPTPVPTPPPITIDPNATTTVVISLVPLLIGGTVHASGSVPISYLQVANTGKGYALIKGFYIKQNGTAPADSIIGLTTVDDKNGSRGSVGGIEGQTPFKNGIAFAPVTNAILVPGEMKLFTIKVVMSSNVSSYVGQQLMIDVQSVDTNATVRGSFPIRGTTWTIAN